MFSGSFTAIVTPLKNNKVDFDAYKKIIDMQIEAGITGIVPCGSTGESATLSHAEHDEVIQKAVEFSKGKLKVIAGTGSNSTAEAIRLSKHAQEVGCDGVLLVAPYYNKPTQKGLYLHYKEVANAIDIPVVLYNIQGRSAVNIEPKTIAQLAKDCKNIVAVKEASGSLDQMSQIRLLAPEMDLISGDDALTVPIMAIGGTGVISVLSNICPKVVADLVNAMLKKDLDKANEIAFKWLPLVKAMFIETNPIPVKAAMAMMGICSDEMRLPMCSLSDEHKESLRKTLKSYNLI
ncbi:4-hydroxy-tetrahydrodipicolinate synthase [Candidatus Ruminimicrobiellum ovillum]|uniref:4-hydroxy-tetrahydrodipicolinate synthase n=1 Tax=Candidatus Ruminimicrobiellum ovillum TaxID=1947927 RepID=UPI00355A9975